MDEQRDAAAAPAAALPSGVSAAVVTHVAGGRDGQACVPYSPQYGDVYHAAAGAIAQAQHVFLAGNGLPGRWQGRSRFVILETGFGLGNNFLATWAAWRADPRRSRQLVFISIEKHPLTPHDLREVHLQSTKEGDVGLLATRLCDAWPPLTPGLHVMDFDEPEQGGQVTLMLALGDIAQVLPRLMAAVDAFYLDGFAPARNPDMWEPTLLARLDRWAAPGATVATWSAARPVRDALTRAGFVVEKAAGFAGKRDMTRAVHAPRHVPAPLPGGLRAEVAPPRHHALVIGAGLAGCSAAWALSREGWQVTLLDRHEAPAREASGNPGGLFHGLVHGQDGPHARAHRAAALMTAAVAGPWIADGRLQGRVDGLLRLDARTTAPEAAALLHSLALGDDYVRWLEPQDAASACGLPVPSGGWLFTQGGWLHPAGYAEAFLQAAQATGLVQWRPGAAVDRLVRTDGGWMAQDASGQPLAEAPTAVLANGVAADAVLTRTLADQPGCPAPLPLSAVRGQVSVWPAPVAAAHEPGAAATTRLPGIPVAGGGYALALGDGRLLCGATTQHGDDEPGCRETDHRHNVQQAVRLGALPPQTATDPLPQGLQGRVGWRAVTPDRLPLIGAVPICPMDGPAPDQPRRIPRLRDGAGGLHVFTGLGSRGITWAALGARLLAHWVTGSPCPVETDLRDALDPARFMARAQRTRAAADARGPAME